MNNTIDKYASAAELELMKGFPPPVDKRVNRSNALMSPPYNRWSYQNMRMFYPTAGIPNADKPSPIQKSLDNDISGLSVAKPDASGRPSGVTVDMETYFRETFVDAFVVVQGNQIVFEKFLNGMHPHQPHQMMSVTKSFAGLFGLMAVEAGAVSENDPVVKYVPELEPAGAFREATFGQVLDMSNSMDFNEDYADPESGIVHYGVVLGLMEPIPGRTYAGSIYEYLPTLPKDPNHAHGEIFHYQTPKTDVVNWVTNRVTGASFQDDLYQKLWSKLGTDGETYVLLDKNATLFAGGGLNTGPYNLARFAMMMLDNGRFNGQQVVPPEVIKHLSAGASVQAFHNGSEAHGIMADNNWSYRAQWWVRHEAGKKAFTAIGIHGQWIYIDITRKIAIVKQSSQPESSTDFYTAYDIHGFDAVIEYLSQRGS